MKVFFLKLNCPQESVNFKENNSKEKYYGQVVIELRSIEKRFIGLTQNIF